MAAAKTLTPAQRTTRARAAAFARAAMYDGKQVTAAATRAQLARYDKLVDPESLLAPDERARRARAALRSHMASLSLAASKVRLLRKRTALAVNEEPARAVNAEVRRERSSAIPV